MKQSIQRNLHRVCPLFRCFEFWNGMAVFNSRNIPLHQPGSLGHLILRKIFVFSQAA